ncbi:MAG TPA: flavodoxin-dependent (E)-4-hydroxy-3-methylbut-2-enyl-diphosphate synthase [Gemmatimonadota bacterium]|nr:flavodoxin-dependent (E)-4-hydroxy-3-methylbut-2-enyl-diphosphate synthase [Gemmatimonadota bacterium]
MFERRRTRPVRVGNVTVGGDAPVSVQSMTTTKTADVWPTLQQIRNLEVAGCDIVRVTVPDEASAEALPEIKAGISIPLVADIHFNYRIALLALDAGVDKLRINPGNIGGEKRVRAVVEKAREKGVPIRIGVNSGSLETDILEKDGEPTARGMVESAIRHCEILERMEFQEIIVSLKSSNVPRMIEAYTRFADLRDYPLHLGVTEAGPVEAGTIKSCAGIGALLSAGIGDTIRISLADDPVIETRVAKKLLQVLDLRPSGINVIACPSCGRAEVDVHKLAAEVEKRTAHMDKNITIAVMGCAVNGPGESREADIGIAGGVHKGLLYLKGQKEHTIREEELVDALISKIESEL